MKPIQQLALDLLTTANHYDDEEFEIVIRTVEVTLDLIHKYGYTAENLKVALNAEYGRMNNQSTDDIIKEFFG
ncbi:hypothetical protein D3C75_881280 [compost metagenome]